ncbi:DUF4181 domain-containing protein [Neobacillus notoginsengisoli]|nr:DUF4181 domain-containing protein [Neobacillus notoginsengisoli]
MLIQWGVLNLLSKIFKISLRKQKAFARTKVGMAFDLSWFVFVIYITAVDPVLLFVFLLVTGIEARRGVEEYLHNRKNKYYIINIANIAFYFIVGALYVWYFKNYGI